MKAPKVEPARAALRRGAGDVMSEREESPDGAIARRLRRRAERRGEVLWRRVGWRMKSDSRTVPDRNPMDCGKVRSHLLGYPHELTPGLVGAVRAHLDVCAACTHEQACERTLTEILEQRLPQHPASLALKRRLAARWHAPTPAQVPRWRQWTRPLVPAFAVALALVVALPLVYHERVLMHQADGTARMVGEAINDHLRVLSSQHPVEIQSGGIHQVKPWFEGRLDFAPVVSFDGDQDFGLEGGAVGYFLDRKAAVFVYRRGLHLISLFVFRADGLPWASRGSELIGDLGYALVSDVDRAELRRLVLNLPRPR